ncbi:MAG: CHAT domain-containing protein, partial [Phormidesmis sp.]
MSKSVIINLGIGDLTQGFPRVAVRLWATGNSRPEQFMGSLPPAPSLVELCRNWQLVYRGLCGRMAYRQPSSVPAQSAYLATPTATSASSNELEISEAGITHVSQMDFDELCQRLQIALNDWLTSAGFLSIEYQLRSRLNPTDLVRVIVETEDPWLRQLPWHRWNFFQDYPKAEMALSQPEYQRRTGIETAENKSQVRILAVFGSSVGIDLEMEALLLRELPNTVVKFLVNPSRQAFNDQLWQPAGWDMLFFAGHSQTHKGTGRIYINENPTHNSLTLLQLEEALKAAIERGLQLAIFNSCDGLGLAKALEQLYIPTVVVMREPVPNRVAQVFFYQFLLAFAQEQQPLYLAFQQARRQLQGLEDDFPAASWLPVICQNLAVEPLTWQQLGGTLPCPYRGLFAFKEEDAFVFFGREQVTEALLVAAQTRSLVAVVGPSGSGKSSVVFAGLIPRLRQTAGAAIQIVSFRPGNSPIESLAKAVASIQAMGGKLRSSELASIFHQDTQALADTLKALNPEPTNRLMLVVDQFEELYTLSSQAEQQSFLEALLKATQAVPSLTLVLTLRADFYGHALSDRTFSDRLQGAIYNLGPMSREELRRAIEAPAASAAVSLEAGLINRLIDDVWKQAGSLPLLEFALTQLWSKQNKGILTHRAYAEIG